MSKIEKLIQRLLSYPKDFTYSELNKILNHFGYEEMKLGSTSGSRIAFFNSDTEHIIRLHKPHPGNILKEYQIKLLIEELKKENILK